MQQRGHAEDPPREQALSGEVHHLPGVFQDEGKSFTPSENTPVSSVSAVPVRLQNQAAVSSTPSERTRGGITRGQASQVQHLSVCLSASAGVRAAPPFTRRQEAVQMHRLRVFNQEQAEDHVAHSDTHRGEALQL